VASLRSGSPASSWATPTEKFLGYQAGAGCGSVDVAGPTRTRLIDGNEFSHAFGSPLAELHRWYSTPRVQ